MALALSPSPAFEIPEGCVLKCVACRAPGSEQLVGVGAVVQPQPTSTPGDPDPRGTRLRGWNAYAGLELRGVYCVLPQQVSYCVLPPQRPPAVLPACH